MLDMTLVADEKAFSGAVTLRLDQADRYCTAHGARLTETRRQVLGLILSSEKPLGAYDLLDHLRAYHRNAAPPTVYRALEFLAEHGLIHKIERLSAFVGCTHRLECHHGEGCGHRAQFLICRHCGVARELEDNAIGVALTHAASRASFRMETATIEIEGICAACQDAVP